MKKLIAIFMIISMMTVLAGGGAINAKSNESVEVPYFNIKPVIDGKFSAEEWGPVTVQAKTANATIRPEAGEGPDKTVDTGSLYHSNHSAVTDLNWDLWLRWDETFIYIGVVVTDPDGYSLPESGGNLWNGDVIQIRFDPDGPNSSGNKNAPWGAVPNMSFGKLNDGTLASYDFSAGDEVPGCQYAVSVEGNKNIYEVAVPHSYIGGKGAADFVYGVSMVVLNAAGPDGTYNSWLTWGDGICGPQNDDDRVGSNAAKLVAVDAIVIPEVEEVAEVAAAGGDNAAPAATAPVVSAQTGDAAYIIFVITALISLAGAYVVGKKAKR